MSGVIAGSAAAQGNAPKAVYWVSAETNSGFGVGGASAMMRQAMAEAQAENAAPAESAPAAGAGIGQALLGGVLNGVAASGGRSGMVAGALGGLMGGFGRGRRAPAPRQAQAPQGAAPQPVAQAAPDYARRLTLELGSSQRPTGAPSAEHLPPAGLQAGASLPLVTPAAAPVAGQSQAYTPTPGETPRGRMLIYWGCGERAAASPITIDLARMAGGRTPNLPVINVNTGTSPTPAEFATLGLWPNDRARVEVPANGSLVGQHTIRGNYSPEIRFALDQGHDFLAPLRLTTARSGGGGTQLSWNSIPGATGYFAQMVGSGADETMVMWSSSGTAASFGYLMDYVPPSEVRRLINSRVVMPPSTTQCIVPAEVVRAAPQGMLQMIAYGDEVNVSNPPNPGPRAPVEWTAKVRFKSTANAMLGMDRGED